MRIVIRPVVDPQREIDLTHRLVAAIAAELWRLYGGNEQLNWIEAERHLERIVGGTRLSVAEAPPATSEYGRADLREVPVARGGGMRRRAGCGTRIRRPARRARRLAQAG